MLALPLVIVLDSATSRAADLPRGWSIDEVEEAGQPKISSRTDSLPGSNNIVDIVYSAPDLWAATAKGPSRLILPGDQWTTYDQADGLPTIEIPSLAAFPNGVWSATSHTEVREGRLVTWGDGLYRFNDATAEWEKRDV